MNKLLLEQLLQLFTQLHNAAITIKGNPRETPGVSITYKIKTDNRSLSSIYVITKESTTEVETRYTALADVPFQSIDCQELSIVRFNKTTNIITEESRYLLTDMSIFDVLSRYKLGTLEYCISDNLSIYSINNSIYRVSTVNDVMTVQPISSRATASLFRKNQITAILSHNKLTYGKFLESMKHIANTLNYKYVYNREVLYV